MTGAAETASSGLGAMHARDAVASLLGMDLGHVAPGTATVSVTIDDRHLNGQGNCHGGVLFVLADMALASASNSHGVAAVAATATIEYLAPVTAGSVVTARADEVVRSGRTGFYDIEVRSGDEVVALFRGRTRVVAQGT